MIIIMNPDEIITLTHERARTILGLLGCLGPVLDAVYVHWPLQERRYSGEAVAYYLDGVSHCLWGPSYDQCTTFEWKQKGVYHRIGGPAHRQQFYQAQWFSTWLSWWENGVRIHNEYKITEAPIKEWIWSSS